MAKTTFARRTQSPTGCQPDDGMARSNQHAHCDEEEYIQEQSSKEDRGEEE